MDEKGNSTSVGCLFFWLIFSWVVGVGIQYKEEVLHKHTVLIILLILICLSVKVY